MSSPETTDIPVFESPTAPQHTLTVGELLAQLQGMDPAAPVLFRSPQYGCFGSHQLYGLRTAETVTIERREHHCPSVPHYDEDTGEEYMTEEHLQVWPEWSGVIIGGLG